jgi:acetolactate synthase-1/2/3 large subunit
MNINGSATLVKLLEQHGVTHIFGIPGAKIDSLFIALLDSKIELVICRHEQNAVFMAAAMGRLTGKVGVCLVTSGPGVTNLVTGMVTATSEGDPVLAIGGEAPLSDRLKHTHQYLDAIDLMKPVTKFAAEAITVDMIPEVFGNAVRAAESGRQGAVFIGLPKDVGLAEFSGTLSPAWGRRYRLGSAAVSEVHLAAQAINVSRKPIVLMGMQSSQQDIAHAIQKFLEKSGMPYIATFQGAGPWAQPEGSRQFIGRVGLFRNQPADKILNESDCVITIGFDPIEFDPTSWNDDNDRPIIAIDAQEVSQDRAFLPLAELIGEIGASLEALTPLLNIEMDEAYLSLCKQALLELESTTEQGKQLGGVPVHPLRVIYEIQKAITKDATIALDVGSHYIWMCRYFHTDYAREILVSNGQQTLGVALPWAIAANIVRPDTPIISISGDGGFLFSATELETAVRIGSRFVHLIWNSASYDMVAFQEDARYGRTAGVKLGHYDVVRFAESFGCRGYAVTDVEQLGPLLKESLLSPVPVLINIPIDYSENMKLMKDVYQDFIH